MAVNVEKAVYEVFRLFEEHGEGDYLGEAVSKTDHSIQCATLAEEEGYPIEVIVGAFLHDIGHLVGADKKMKEMLTGGVSLGAKDHDLIGGQFVKDLGFPDKVCDLVRNHVQAKRYLVWKNPEYHENLSSASKMTLEHQGGPMSTEEAKTFEESPLFDIIIKMRTWDEAGKKVDVSNVSLDKYKSLCTQLLSETLY